MIFRYPRMKSRTADFELKKGKNYAQKQNSFSSKEQPNSKKGSNVHRRMKSEERTTSIYINPPKNNKSSKMYHDKSASNRIMFKQDFDDYIQSNTSRKNKNMSKKK